MALTVPQKSFDARNHSILAEMSSLILVIRGNCVYLIDFQFEKCLTNNYLITL